jgi:hypothetical protein
MSIPRLYACRPVARRARIRSKTRQIARYGSSVEGMPIPWVYRGTDGELMIFDGVTRPVLLNYWLGPSFGWRLLAISRSHVAIC